MKKKKKLKIFLKNLIYIRLWEKYLYNGTKVISNRCIALYKF